MEEGGMLYRPRILVGVGQEKDYISNSDFDIPYNLLKTVS